MRVSSPVAAASPVSTIPPVSISIALPTGGLAGAGSRPVSTEPMPQLTLPPRTTRIGRTEPLPEGRARTAIPATPMPRASQPRDGGQAQFVPVLVDNTTDGPDLAALRDWALGHLREPLTVGDLARHVHMSPRTFAR